jgi:transposase InsO family protein
VDFVRVTSTKVDFSVNRILVFMDFEPGKYYEWKKRYGKINLHNSYIPRDYWITKEETQAIMDYHIQHPFDGYRRLTYMMIDENIVAVSPSTVYRVLKRSGLMDKFSGQPSKKGTGFNQPSSPHKHWHIDISYINIDGTFYYMCTIIDGHSRFIIQWDIGECMKESDIELIIERAKETYPGVTPRIISDNGPQFISKDFKEYIKLSGMTHVRTSPYYPQSNGKIERFHKTIKTETIRKRPPESLKDAVNVLTNYIEFYNTKRLNSAIGYITPQDMLEGKAEAILEERKIKLENARKAREETNKNKKAA